MEKKKQTKITDFDSFWKIITLVCVAIIAEGVILWAATSNMAVDWTYDNVIAPRVVAEEVNVKDVKTDIKGDKTIEVNKVKEISE